MADKDGCGMNTIWLFKISLIIYIPLKEQTTGGALQKPSSPHDMLTVPL